MNEFRSDDKIINLNPDNKREESFITIFYYSLTYVFILVRPGKANTR